MQAFQVSLVRVVLFGSGLLVGSSLPRSQSEARIQAEREVLYKVVIGTDLLTDRAALEEALNNYGAEGWELVHVVDRSTLRAGHSAAVKDFLILKR